MRIGVFFGKIVLAVCAVGARTGMADAQGQALRLYTSLTGSVPSKAYLRELQALVSSGQAVQAARKIITERSEFYNVTLRNFATPWTNRDGSVLAPLNDFSATVIGAVRDGIPFNRIFFEDIIYFADGDITGDNLDQVRIKGGLTIPQYFKGNNDHYEALESASVDLLDPQILSRQSQTPLLHREVNAIAGIFSTRAFGEAYFQAGTNRRAVAFTMENFLCRAMEQLNDTSVADFRVRRDVDRSPGGDSRTFKSLCVGCHSGMDAMAGAFSYYDFDTAAGTLFYTDGAPVTKTNHNALYPDGFITQSDSWQNLWSVGQNGSLGWSNRLAGNGAADFGRMITEAEAFPTCMAEQVFKQVCFHEPTTDEEKAHVEHWGSVFATTFDMAQLFAATATSCMGE